MSHLYAIADTHFSFDKTRSMEKYSGWNGYIERICGNWSTVSHADDTIVIAGDRYNSKSISESSDEFDLLCRLPGKKILIKGNHDLWWKNIGAMHKILSAFPSNSLNYLRNNYFEFEKYAICGATGVDMLLMNQNEVVNRRNRLRIEKSLQSASEKGLQPIVFLHYPPCLYDYQKHLHFDEELCEIFWKYNVKQCDYGHLHGEDCKNAFNGIEKGIKYQLISADFVQFQPKLVV